MKKLLVFLLTQSFSCNSQDTLQYFTLEDTTFQVGAVYQLQDMQFELHQNDLSEAFMKASVQELDNIVSFLEKNYLLSIEIGAYTDTRGSQQANLELSSRQAQSIEDYLISKGISRFQTSSKGYGETTPYRVRASDLASHPYLKEGQLLTEKFINSLEKEQWEPCFQLNQRTELKIRWIMQRPIVVPVSAENLINQGVCVIPDIRFELGRATIHRASYPQVDLIVEFLEENPSVILEIGNHCDCRASSSSSTRLTQRRADSIVKYIMDAGIAAERLVPRGYFKNVPYEENGIVYTCDYINQFKDDKPTYEAMLQKRRRTELKVLSTEYQASPQKIWEGIVKGGNIPSDKPILIPGIEFDFDKAILRPSSLSKLDSLVQFLDENPSLVIEIANHTDCRGDREMYSVVLSQKRAEAIVDYLVSRGIAIERLVAKGYEDKQPYNYRGNDLSCEYIAGLKVDEERYHKMNRRTEIRIIATNYMPSRKGTSTGSPVNLGH